MEHEYSTKGVIRDIISMQRFLREFKNHGKDYIDLVDYFVETDFSDEDTRYPSIKELQEKLGIKYAVLRRKLTQLYEDMIAHESFGIDFSIHKVEYVFHLRYFDKQAYFTINNLPVIPRVGEEIWFPFLREKVGTDFFHVSHIDHTFDDTKQSVNISLRSGSYNLFWHLKKDEAYEKEDISLREYYSEDDHKLRNKIRF